MVFILVVVGGGGAVLCNTVSPVHIVQRRIVFAKSQASSTQCHRTIQAKSTARFKCIIKAFETYIEIGSLFLLHQRKDGN